MYDVWEEERGKVATAVEEGGMDVEKEMGSRAFRVDVTIPITIRKRIVLEGEELARYLREEQQRVQASQQSLIVQPELLEDLESESDDEELGSGLAGVGGDLGGAGGVGGNTAPGFDIYIKDSIRHGGFFKGSQTYRMYPVPDHRKRVDDYGEVIDPGVYSNAEYAISGGKVSLKEGEEEDRGEKVVVEVDERPSRFDVEEGVVDVKCWIAFVDFEGRSDGGFVRHCLPMVGARKVVSFFWSAFFLECVLLGVFGACVVNGFFWTDIGTWE